MRFPSFTHFYCAATCAASLILGAAGAPARAEGSCVPSASQATPEALKAFQSDPGSLLNRSPVGGGRLAADVRNIAVTGSNLGEMAALVKGANAEQGRAIGAGLGQAALLCRKSSPDAARQIQELIVASNKAELLTSYQSVVQEEVTAAIPAAQTAAAASAVEVEGDSNPAVSPNRATQQQSAGGGAEQTPPLAFFAVARATSGSQTAQVVATPSALLAISPSN